MGDYQARTVGLRTTEQGYLHPGMDKSRDLTRHDHSMKEKAASAPRRNDVVMSPRESMEIGSGKGFRINEHAASTIRHDAMRSPKMSPSPPHPAGSAAPKAHRSDKHTRIGMHVEVGEARPTRGKLGVREMVRPIPSAVSSRIPATRSCSLLSRAREELPRLLIPRPQICTPPSAPAPEPFWQQRTPERIATPRGGSGGGKRPNGYMGWMPGETYDLSAVTHQERSIRRPMTTGFIPPLEDRAAIRGCMQKSSGYRGHIPRRFDISITLPGGRGAVDQDYIHHSPGRVGHPDMPPTSLEPHVADENNRTIEKDSSKLVHRVRPEVCHMYAKTERGVPRGTRVGVGYGYAGHVPKLFGGMKSSPGVEPSLLNGPGLCEQPRVDFEKSMRLGSHSALTARDEWQRRPSNNIAYDLKERNYTGKHVPSQPVSRTVRAFSPRFRGVGGAAVSPGQVPMVGASSPMGFGEHMASPTNWVFDAKDSGGKARGAVREQDRRDDVAQRRSSPKNVSISPAPPQ